MYGYSKDSFSDWPGKIAPVIFVRGCNCLCPTCHNAILAYDFSRKTQKPVSKATIYQDIRSKKYWYDGIVISGGEPSLVPELGKWLKNIKKTFGLPLKVDTNGLKPEVIISLLEDESIDFLGLDVKGPFNLYPELIGKRGVDVSEIREKLEMFFKLDAEMQKKIMYRLTAVPLISEDDIEEVRSYLPYSKKLRVQQYIERE